MRRSLLSLSFLMPLSVQACPDLQSFYMDAGTPADAAQLEARLAPFMSECLESSEYFALFGAAQMDAGRLAEALETLERALLLDPTNGAAQIDYAQALYMRGQLFSALDLNAQLLARSDLTPELRGMLEERRQVWRQQTREHGFQADVLTGYDNNLNGAPDPSQITLTLSGEPVLLTLNPEYRPVSGPFLNLRVGGNYRQQESDHQHNLLAEMRGRVSKDTDSDLLQMESRYAYVRPRRNNTLQLGAGLSHLLFGGSPLYTALDGDARYTITSGDTCQQHYAGAFQYQLYHNQSSLNSVEMKAGAGLECPLVVGSLPSTVGAEFSVLHNQALNNGRPGGHRSGWQMQLDWQFPLLSGVFRSQLNHTELADRKGYSPVLANGADRWLRRSYLLLQYRQPLYTDLALLVNFYHQHQQSNIELFESLDSTLEVGISLAF
ncbi:MAG: tetratricopeptide repeat protein [Pseudomonadota bacterium]